MSTTADAQAAAVPPTGGSSIKEMGMRKILFEKWDKQAASGELQKNPDILTKIYLGMQWLELHPEFGMEVAKYRAGLSGENGEAKDVSAANLVPWKPDPMIVDMWKRWAQEQEEQKEDTERAFKSETNGAPASIMDPTRQQDDSTIKQSCQCTCS